MAKAFVYRLNDRRKGSPMAVLAVGHEASHAYNSTDELIKVAERVIEKKANNFDINSESLAGDYVVTSNDASIPFMTVIKYTPGKVVTTPPKVEYA